MKKFTLIALFLATAFGLFWLSNQQVANEVANLNESVEKNAEEQEPKGIAGALAYLNSMRINPNTGLLDPTDVHRAQKDYKIKSEQKAGTLEWEFMGPNNVGGRTRCIIIDRTNPSYMVVGGVSGGIFTSNNGGLEWIEHPQNRQLSCINISAGVQAANNTDMYIGTGELIFNGVEAGTGNSAFPGCGLLKSTDSGQTWEFLPATIPGPNDDTQPWSYIIALEAHPTNANLIYAATDASLFVSQDAGATWEAAQGVSAGTAYDVVAASDGTIHALVSNKYYKSTDGINFVEKSGTDIGLFPNVSGNKKIAISPEDPNYVYIITTKTTAQQNGCLNQVLQSTNGGEGWVQIGAGSDSFEPLGNSAQCQGWFDLCIVVDPANKERIFVGGVTMWSWSSTDGWLQVDNLFESPANPYYVHADKHIFRFHPSNPNILYIGNDGGIARTIDAGNVAPTFSTINKNYNVTQFYSVAADNDGRVMAGAQDNGTQLTSFNVDSYLAGTRTSGGDGAYVDFAKSRDNIAFAATQNGNLLRSSNDGESFGGGFLDQTIDCEPSNPDGSCNGDGSVDGNPEFITKTLLWEDLSKGKERNRTFTAPNGTSITLQYNPGPIPELEIEHYYELEMEMADGTDVILFSDGTPEGGAPNSPTAGVVFFDTPDCGEPTCKYVIRLQDRGGDGWECSTVDVIQDNTDLDSYTVAPIPAVYVTGNGRGEVFMTLNSTDAATVPAWYNLSDDLIDEIGTGFISGIGPRATITSLRVSRDDEQRIMVVVGTAEGGVALIRDIIEDEQACEFEVDHDLDSQNRKIANTTVTYIDPNDIDPDARYVTAVYHDPTNPQQLIVTMGNYGFDEYVYASSNVLTSNPTFVSLQGAGENALPPMPVYDITVDRGNPFKAYAATDMGVWSLDFFPDGLGGYSASWTSENEDIGNVPVHRIRQEVKGEDVSAFCYVLYIGTHGSGMWRSTTNTFFTCDTALPCFGCTATNVNDNLPVNNQPTGIKIYPNPLSDNGMVEINLRKPTTAMVSIYNIGGKLVRNYDLGQQDAGSQRINVNVEDLMAGTYILTLDTNEGRESSKFIVQ